jgi:hypothetical protein
MRITVETKRECCQEEDLKQYWGSVKHGVLGLGADNRLFFCVHCGQLWHKTTAVDASLGKQSCTVKINPDV